MAYVATHNELQPEAQLPSAEQLEAYRNYLKAKKALLEQQHTSTHDQAEIFRKSGNMNMHMAYNSLAANIWTTRSEIQYCIDAFNHMYPEPKEA